MGKLIPEAATLRPGRRRPPNMTPLDSPNDGFAGGFIQPSPEEVLVLLGGVLRALDVSTNRLTEIRRLAMSATADRNHIVVGNASGVEICYRATNSWHADVQGLPRHEYHSLAIDGDRCWAGGASLARLNLPQRQVEHIYRLHPGEIIKCLELDGNELWITAEHAAVGTRIYRLDLED